MFWINKIRLGQTSRRLDNWRPWKWVVKIVLICSFTILLSLPGLAAGTQKSYQTSAASLTLSPSSGTITGCGTLNVEVWVNDVSGLYGVDLRMSFNPAVLEVVDSDPGKTGVQVQEGGFLANTWVLSNTADNTSGTIQYIATQLNPELAKGGTGKLLIIQFRAKSASLSTPLNFTYAELADRDGIAIPGSSSNGALQTIAPTSPALSITRLNSTDVRLSWSPITDIANYRLYRDTIPYFTPVDPAYQITTNLGYDDLGALGDVNVQHYYVVKSACANGFKSNLSNRVGEYDFALRSVASSNYNDIALVLTVPTISDAASLATYIGSSVRYVSRYNPATQSFQTYIVGNPGTNFSLSTGQFAFVITDTTAPASFALVGGVPLEGSVSFTLVSGSPAKYNYLSLPLDQGSLTLASQVVTDIGSGVVYLMRYRIETQSYQAYIPGNPSTDFPLVVGEPFELILTTGAPSQWP